MKNKKLVYIIIAVVLSLVTIAITGFVLAEESKNKSYEELNRTAVVLEPKKDETTGNYTGEVEVLLQMDDGIRTEEQQPNEDGTIIEDAASVQSFQIGLDVSASVESEEDISFEFNPMLKENAKNDVAGEVKLARVTEELVKGATEEEKEIYKGEKLNIYYVGTKDLNDTNSREMISVGTLKIKVPENSNNESVLVYPIKEVTTASSTGHTQTPIDVHPEEDGITFIMNEQDSEHENDSGNTSGGNTSSGNTAGDNTTGNGTTGGNTAGDNTTGGGSTGGNSGNNGSTTGNPGGSGNSGNGGSTGGSQNNGYSQLDEDKAKGNLANKLLEALKTGANHSLTWIIVAIIVLTIVAIGIIKLKNNTSKKEGKHSKH